MKYKEILISKDIRGSMIIQLIEEKGGGYSAVKTGLKVKVLVAQLCLTLCDPRDCSPTRLLCPWNSPGETANNNSN